MARPILILALVLAFAAPAGAAEPVENQPGSTHPTMAARSTWPGVVVIVILGIFAAAMLAGPIIRANSPEDVTPASHDEPPGASGHHGADGAAPHD
ncbi:MAG TPA: hypothetical protein VG269_04545 [Tepidisphaeraceae bacterium]|jgi:hypothetical protein|nr:hypothetical protein [Tepidisphaeraceae bacterium]